MARMTHGGMTRCIVVPAQPLRACQWVSSKHKREVECGHIPLGDVCSTQTRWCGPRPPADPARGYESTLEQRKGGRGVRGRMEPAEMGAIGCMAVCVKGVAVEDESTLTSYAGMRLWITVFWINIQTIALSLFLLHVLQQPLRIFGRMFERAWRSLDVPAIISSSSSPSPSPLSVRLPVATLGGGTKPSVTLRLIPDIADISIVPSSLHLTEGFHMLECSSGIGHFGGFGGIGSFGGFDGFGDIVGISSFSSISIFGSVGGFGGHLGSYHINHHGSGVAWSRFVI
ncbi:hypothetical protein L204_104741 [Cryptococcus depauperatus]